MSWMGPSEAEYPEVADAIVKGEVCPVCYSPIKEAKLEGGQSVRYCVRHPVCSYAEVVV